MLSSYSTEIKYFKTVNGLDINLYTLMFMAFAKKKKNNNNDNNQYYCILYEE